MKRVPLDFDYPLNKVWYGYLINYHHYCVNEISNRDYCKQCELFSKTKGIKMTDYGCPTLSDYFSEINKKLNELCEPPKGDGYQLWETTSEGSPVSPVFETLDGLCEWCEVNATTFSTFKATKEEWKQMLIDDFVYAKDGDVVFS